MTATASPDIQYGNDSIREFRVGKRTKTGDVATIVIGDSIEAEPTDRFWTSLCSKYSTYGLSTKLFKMFSHSEVFQRLHDIVHNKGADRLHWTVEKVGSNNRLLAVCKPTAAILPHDDLRGLLESHAIDASKVSYNGGVIRSEHAPSHMPDFMVGNDVFSYRYMTETPIDGYGRPLIYLSVLRQICTNGLIGRARAFRSEANLGKDGDGLNVLSRLFDSFNNEDGFSAMRQRLESAKNSTASIGEAKRIYEVMHRMLKDNDLRDTKDKTRIENRAVKYANKHKLSEFDAPGQTPLSIKLNRAFTDLTGDVTLAYSVASMGAISNKRQSQLPVKCSVYDLINFTTELATHYTEPHLSTPLHSEIGQLITSEYDLEGLERESVNADFYVSNN